MKLNRLFGALLIIVVAVAIVVFIVFQQQNSFCPSRAVLEPAAPGYIGNSSIYLLSAKPYYGTYHGTPVFMITVTVRNDYTAQQPPPNQLSGINSTGEAWIILAADLYEKNSVQIRSGLYTSSGVPPNYFQVGLNSGQTTSLTIYMETNNRDVEHYTLILGWLGAFPWV